MVSNSTVHGKTGFTLIELLVVVAIISLLIAILVPSLRKAKNYAIRVMCATQMHDIGVLLSIYAADNGGKLPPRPVSGNVAVYPQLKLPLLLDNGVAKELIEHYGVDPARLVCPTYNRQPETYEAIGTDNKGNSFIGRDYFNHGYNMWWTGYAFLFNWNDLVAGLPSYVPSAADGLDDPNTVLAADLLRRSHWTWDGYASTVLTSHRPNGYVPEGGHSVFVDGHVRWFSKDELGPNGEGIDQQGNWAYSYDLGHELFWGVE
jgi:prepilin-type N-terminal cleavage/methylation domain-containing protein